MQKNEDSGPTVIKPSFLPVINITPQLMTMPKMFTTIFINKNSLPILRMFSEIKTGQIYAFLVMSKPGITKVPDRFYSAGVVCSVAAKDDDMIFIAGECRAEAASPFRLKDNSLNSYWITTVTLIQDENPDALFVDSGSKKRIRADLIKVRHLLQRLYNEGKGVWEFPSNDAVKYLIDSFENYDFGDKDAVDHFVWRSLAAIPELIQENKQPFIESTNLFERLTMLINLLKAQIEVLVNYKKPDRSNGTGMKDGKDSDQKYSKPDPEDAAFSNVHPAIKNFWKRFKEIRDFMPEDAKTVASEDLDRLVSYGDPQSNTHEWPKFKRHLEFILDLPWNRETEQASDITKVTQTLEEDHYGLTHVKEKIGDSIAPKLLNPSGRGQIICLIGPPGVGKTSLAKSVARALNRKLIRESLGGITNEAQIRGHDVTYVGSQPGEILREIKRCGVKKPVFVIDEIDKLGRHSMAGDPSSAMLEVLDPEQNYSFRDHYLGCSFDLSKVMFIATANVEDDIIPPLRDRMDVIRLPGYLEVEKIEIAKRYLIPRWMEEVGLTKNNVQVNWSEDSVPLIIRGYTNEAGVRNLDRNIANILRKIAGKFLKSQKEGEAEKVFNIDNAMIGEIFGPVKFFKDKARPTKVGVAVGLAWTEVGGSILYIQSVLYPNPIGKKVFARTGMQGDVMKEADEVAMSLVRMRLEETNREISKDWRRNGIHLHIPEGAIHKDGPSAGLTVFASLYSLAIKQPLRPFVAMTGEIDLAENVLPVGGIREKIVAAERAGITDVILPKANERNLYDVPNSVKEKVHFHFVESVQEAVAIAFPKPE